VGAGVGHDLGQAGALPLCDRGGPLAQGASGIAR
jgi:hypothetical protein